MCHLSRDSFNRLSCGLLFLFTAISAADAGTVPELVGYVNTDGKIVVRPRGDATIETIGLALISEAGNLIPLPPGDLSASAAPFTFVLANSATDIVIGNVNSLLPIPSTGMTLEAGYEGNPCGELEVQWGDGQSALFPVGSMPPERQIDFGFCSIFGDANFDGKVELEDFLVLSVNFGAAPADWPMGDFDYDGRVGFSDFLALSTNFGVNAVPMAASVPEPSHHAGVLFAVFSWLIRFPSRRK